jgi:dihydrofolate reductase
MADLVYTGITSLDGYVVDADGNFDWSVPDEEVHGFVNDLERDVGTYLYGRRLYEVMAAWETLGGSDQSAEMSDYAEIWRGADKVVYSSTLQAVTSSRTRIERRFDASEVSRMKQAAQRPLSIGGPTLAAHAITARLVDEVRMLVSPVSVGGGIPFLPRSTRVTLSLLEERRFGNGVVYVRYRVTE